MGSSQATPHKLILKSTHRSFRVEGKKKRSGGRSEHHGEISPRVSAQNLVREIGIDAARLPGGLGGVLGFPQVLAAAGQHRVQPQGLAHLDEQVL